jgi:hypothetical protein
MLIDRGGKNSYSASYCAWRPTVESIPSNLWRSVMFKRDRWEGYGRY